MKKQTHVYGPFERPVDFRNFGETMVVQPTGDLVPATPATPVAKLVVITPKGGYVENWPQHYLPEPFDTAPSGWYVVHTCETLREKRLPMKWYATRTFTPGPGRGSWVCEYADGRKTAGA